MTGKKISDLTAASVLGSSDKLVVEQSGTAKSITGSTLLRGKADIDGYYEEMSVGNAEQLISSVGINDKTPYNFRTSGGSNDIGDRKNEKIVGGTVAWNQMVQNGDFSNGTNWASQENSGNLSITDGIARVTRTTGTPSASSPALKNTDQFLAVEGHKYLISVDMRQSKDGGSPYFRSPTYTSQIITSVTLSTNWQTVAFIKNATDNNVLIYYIGNYNATTVLTTNDWIEYRNYHVHDLTAMFGSTIADYVYSLEQANEGTGVAWFKKLFPKDYYPYNAGELLSVKTSKAVMTGFNAYNHTSGVAEVLAGLSYQITGTYTALSLEGESVTPDANGLFMPSKTGTLTVTGGDSNSTCVHLVWDGERNGEYESYTTYEYPLDSSLELRGIPKLDANNKLYYDGDVYESDGTVTRKWGVITFDGTQPVGLANWRANESSVGWLYAPSVTPNLKNIQTSLGNQNYLVCDKLMPVIYTGSSGVYGNTISCISIVGSDLWGIAMRVADTSLTSASAINAWLAQHPVTVYYPLTAPTTETADPYTDPMIVNDWGTEEFVDNRDVAIPVGHDTFYQANLKAKLEMAPDSPDGDGDYIVRQSGGINEYVPFASNSTIDVFSATILTSGATATITLGNSKTVADLYGSKPSALYINNYDSGGSGVDFNMLVLLNVDDFTASTMRIDGVAYANSKRLRVYGTYNNSATALNAYWENIPVPPKQEQIILVFDDWVTGSGGGFLTQTVSLSGITSSSVVWVSPEPYGDNVEDYANAKVYCSGQGSGTLTFNTIGTPTITEDIDVIVIWM